MAVFCLQNFLHRLCLCVLWTYPSELNLKNYLNWKPNHLYFSSLWGICWWAVWLKEQTIFSFSFCLSPLYTIWRKNREKRCRRLDWKQFARTSCLFPLWFSLVSVGNCVYVCARERDRDTEHWEGLMGLGRVSITYEINPTFSY